MSGYKTIQRIRSLEEEIDKLGFKFSHSKRGFYDKEYGEYGEYGDVVALVPKDHDSLPIYSRDAEVFLGTLESLEVWLRGVEWARNYDIMLKVSDDKKRERKEQDVRNKRLVSILRDEKVEEIDP